MPPVTSRQRTQALLMLVLATSFWGLSFPLIKAVVLTHLLLIPGSNPWFVTSWALAPRFLIGSVILLCTQWRALRSLTKPEWHQGLSLGLFAAAGMLFQTNGLQYTTASTSAFLTQLYAILIPIYLAVLSKRLPPWTVWVSSFLVLAGVSILGQFDWHGLRLGRGEAETLISSCFFMGQILSLDGKSFGANRVMPVTTIMFFIQAFLFLVLALCTASHPSDLLTPLYSISWDVTTGVLALLCTLAALTIMNTFQPRITATEAGLIYCVEPVFGSIFALFLPALLSRYVGISYPNEIATHDLVLGGGLITAANILIQLKPPPKVSV